MDEYIALETFNGVMVGDGSLHRALRAGACPELCYGVKDSRFTLTQSTEQYDHMDWLLFVRDAFIELRVRTSSGYPKYVAAQSRGKIFGSSKLLTLTSPWLTGQRKRWYPGGVKEVPEDFQFTPISLANAWMSDGGATRDKRCSVVVNLHLEAQNFSLSSISIIEQALHHMGVSHTGRGTEERGNSGVRITILQKSVDVLMSIIEPWILPSFKYKVKYKDHDSIGLSKRVGVKRATELLIKA